MKFTFLPFLLCLSLFATLFYIPHGKTKWKNEAKRWNSITRTFNVKRNNNIVRGYMVNRQCAHIIEVFHSDGITYSISIHCKGERTYKPTETSETLQRRLAKLRQFCDVATLLFSTIFIHKCVVSYCLTIAFDTNPLEKRNTNTNHIHNHKNRN